MTDRNRSSSSARATTASSAPPISPRRASDVVVLEAADQVGGAAVTREFAPGFRVSACAHLSYLLDAGISRELDLAKHGSQSARANLRTVALAARGEHLVSERRRARVRRSCRTRTALRSPRYHAQMLAFARVLGKQHNRRRRASRRRALERDRRGAAGLDIRRLGRDDCASSCASPASTSSTCSRRLSSRRC